LVKQFMNLQFHAKGNALYLLFANNKSSIDSINVHSQQMFFHQ